MVRGTALNPLSDFAFSSDGGTGVTPLGETKRIFVVMFRVLVCFSGIAF